MTQVKRLNATAVHSVNRFVFSVPSLDEAEKFYQCFGLKTNRQGKQLDLYTHGHDHCWGSVHESGKAKRLEYLSFGAYAEDFEALKKQALMVAKQVDPHPLSDGQGFWLRDTDGNQVQLVIGNKVTPNAKAAPGWPLSQPNAIGSPVSPMRSKAPRVQPQRLSHVLLFATDVPALSNFYQQALGLRMSDQSQDLIAFLHGAHSSDHHLLAMVKSEAPGLHHTSWAVRSIDEVGLGMEQMTAAGYKNGWGMGRHVIGSNYFYYVQDPWGSFSEFSYDIDFIGANDVWPSGDYPPEDSFYFWGPSVPDYFTINTEATRS